MIFIVDQCDPGVEEISLVFVDSDGFDATWAAEQIKAIFPEAEIIGVADSIRWNDHHGHYKRLYQFIGPWVSLDWDEDGERWLPTRWWLDLDDCLKTKFLSHWLTEEFNAWHEELGALTN